MRDDRWRGASAYGMGAIRMTARQIETELSVQREILKVQQREARRTLRAILRLARELRNASR